MISRARLLGALLIPVCLALSAVAQSGGVRADMKDRVLDILFRSDAASPLFFSKVTLRYGDSDTQLVVLTYPVYPVHPGGQAEIISYGISGLGDGNLSDFIGKIAAQNPNVTDQEIAARLKVIVKQSPIGYDAFTHMLDELKAIRISPVLASRVALDECYKYEFWYNTGQESVHYLVTGPFNGAPQDHLVQWMIRFRASVPKLIDATPAKPSAPR